MCGMRPVRFCCCVGGASGTNHIAGRHHSSSSSVHVSTCPQGRIRNQRLSVTDLRSAAYGYFYFTTHSLSGVRRSSRGNEASTWICYSLKNISSFMSPAELRIHISFMTQIEFSAVTQWGLDVVTLLSSFLCRKTEEGQRSQPAHDLSDVSSPRSLSQSPLRHRVVVTSSSSLFLTLHSRLPHSSSLCSQSSSSLFLTLPPCVHGRLPHSSSLCSPSSSSLFLPVFTVVFLTLPPCVHSRLPHSSSLFTVDFLTLPPCVHSRLPHSSSLCSQSSSSLFLPVFTVVFLRLRSLVLLLCESASDPRVCVLPSPHASAARSYVRPPPEPGSVSSSVLLRMPLLAETGTDGSSAHTGLTTWLQEEATEMWKYLEVGFTGLDLEPGHVDVLQTLNPEGDWRSGSGLVETPVVHSEDTAGRWGQIIVMKTQSHKHQLLLPDDCLHRSGREEKLKGPRNKRPSDRCVPGSQ
ncbi:unnamed protein product [Pleuronectes platessa]|uniref:Uncharacterized protein n=1 Tax=Pleuronectes platessa TaxID=8262 RepID=A0A9N7V673_PLEPL|nr:unnamed protein product [Pleuronectes platessa]